MARAGGCSDAGSGREQGLRCRAWQVDHGWCRHGSGSGHGRARLRLRARAFALTGVGDSGSGRLGKTRAHRHCGSGEEGEDK